MIVPWNEELWLNLTARRDRNTHAWLFCGVAGLGKSDVAVAYAEFLLGGSHGFSAGSHPDFHVLSPEQQLDEGGSLLQRYGMRYYVTDKKQKAKAVISVDQVRALVNSIVTYAHGSNKVVVVSPAHRMNINAANALLKALEEPPSNTIFILVSDRPDLLPATIRSRCSRIDFRVPARQQAMSWLSERTGNANAALALSVAGGAPLQAEKYTSSGFLEAREVVLGDIKAVLEGGTDIVSVPGRWKGLEVEQSLGILRGLMMDLVKTRFVPRPPWLINPDQLDWLQHAAKRIHLSKVLPLIERVGVFLRDINSPLDKNLVLEDFLLELGNVCKK
jgi:DNA polymerase-3 subunit delta'